MKRKIFWVKGSDLSPEMREAAKARYIYRWTCQHVPDWCLPIHQHPRGMWTHKRPYPWPLFDTDQQWEVRGRKPSTTPYGGCP